jgi:hypothetical protein
MRSLKLLVITMLVQMQSKPDAKVMDCNAIKEKKIKENNIYYSLRS